MTRIAAVAAASVLPLAAPLGAAHAAGGQGMTVAASCLGTPGTIHLHVLPSSHGTVHADVTLTGLSTPDWSGMLTWDPAHAATTPLTSYVASSGSISVSGDSTVQSWPALTYAGFQVADDPQAGCTMAAAHVGPAYFMQSIIAGATLVASRTGSLEVRAVDVRKGERFTVIARVRTSKGWQKRIVKVAAKAALRTDKIKVPGLTNLSAFKSAEVIVVRPKFGERDILTMTRD